MNGTLAQGFVHSLHVVHLTVAYAARLPAETFKRAVGLFNELLGGNVFNTAVHDITGCNLVGFGMLAQQFEFGGKRTKGRFHPIALPQPHCSDFLEQSEEPLYLAAARMAIFGAELVNVVKAVLVLYDGLGIEQRLAVVTFCGARLQFKEYSVGLAWHIVKDNR